MSLKINPILAIAILIGIGVLIIALVRGCQNGKKAASAVVDYKGRINKLEQDSVNLTRYLNASADTIEFLNGQSALSDNKLLSLNENLDKANDRISILLRKHIPIKPNPDTSVTLVPNVYIEECTDCFNELSDGRDSVMKYRAERDNQERIYKSKLSVKDNSINYLEKLNGKLTKDYKSLIDSTKDTQKQKGKMYLSWGVMWGPVPKMAGAGLMYQTPRSMILGAKWYYGAQGHMVETNINLPLSFKRK